MSDIFPTKPSSLEVAEKGLKKLENQIYEECNSVILSVVKDTFDIDPADPELPAAWLEEIEAGTLTKEEAAKRKRIAQYALMPPKEAPVALQIAAKVLSGMHKARAMEGAGPKHLNLTMVSISAPNQPVPLFPVKEIKHE
jgi:hypothetical protein